MAVRPKDWARLGFERCVSFPADSRLRLIALSCSLAVIASLSRNTAVRRVLV